MKRVILAYHRGARKLGNIKKGINIATATDGRKKDARKEDRALCARLRGEWSG
jgi:hypothetical protein